MGRLIIDSPCGCRLTGDQVKSLWSAYCNALGGGRPRSTNRCACGEMTQARAAARGHHCVAPVARKRAERNRRQADKL